MPKKMDPAFKERAVRLVREHRAECPSNGTEQKTVDLGLA
jgi:hypothetical protein